MATLANNNVVKGFRGKFGNDLVFRTMRGKTFISPPASKSNKKKESEAQRATRVTFRKAADWAQITLLDPEKKTYYKQRAKALKLPNAYTAAITDYMRKPKVAKTEKRGTITYRVYKPGFVLKDVKVEHAETTGVQPKIVTRQQNSSWFVYYTPADVEAIPITLIITNNARKEHRFVEHGPQFSLLK